MTPDPSELYALEKELFLRALELEEPEKQRAFLARECGEHDALHKRLQRLLNLHDNQLLEPSENIELERERVLLAQELSREGASFEGIGSSIQVIGDYELDEEIGRGAMGVVFKARQRRLHRDVAIKIIGGAALVSLSERERFRREAQAAGHLDHPNIVPVYEVGQHGECDFYSMALIKGGTLGELMEQKRLPRIRAVTLLATVARAMQTAHQQGIIHRDLKPDNILLDECEEPHISDFGLACRLEQRGSLTLTGQIMGTPQYMAPEQADPSLGPVTTAVDIYSLGSILYELLVGVPVFRGDSALHILRLAKEAPPRPLRQVDPTIDRDLNTIVLKCLEKNATDRYRSAAALASDLEAWLGHLPIAARAPSPGERMVKWIRRHPVHAALLGIILFMILAFSIGGPLTAVHQAYLKNEADAARSDALEKAEENKRQAYFGQMNQLGYAADRGGVPPALKNLVDRWAPDKADSEDDMRCWEWYLFASHFNEPRHTIEGDGNRISDLMISPDGTRMAACSTQSSTVRIWECQSAKLIHEFKPHTDGVVGLVWSQDGTLLVTASKDRTVALWNSNTWDLVRRSDAKGAPVWNCVIFNPDESVIAAGAMDETVRLLDANTLAEIGRLPAPFEGGPWRLSWNQENVLAVCGTLIPGNKTIRLYRLGKEPLTVTSGTASSVMSDLAWRPNGHILAISSWDRHVHFYDRERRFLVGGHSDKIGCIAWRPDGMQFATGAENRELLIWDYQERQTQVSQILSGHAFPVDRLNWSKDGHILAAGDRNGGIKLWYPQENRIYRSAHKRPIGLQTLRWGPEGRRIACAGPDGFLVVVDADSGSAMEPSFKRWPSELELPPESWARIWGPYSMFDWSRDGRFLAYRMSKTGFAVIDFETGTRSDPIVLPEGRTMSMAWDPAGRHLLIATHLRRLLLWDRETGEFLRKIKTGRLGQRPIVSWSPDGRYVLVSGKNRHHCVFSSDSWELVSESVEENSPAFLDGHAWHQDGNRYATSGGDATIRFWMTGKDTPYLEAIGHTGFVRSIAWHPNEPRLASGGSDSMVKIWDTDTGQLAATLSGHTEAVNDLRWSRDGRKLASVSLDGELLIWDAEEAYLAQSQ